MEPLEISGVTVHFPMTPYQCQLDMMEKMISSMNNGTNALLESPTGTGKTLALLCASLSWQEHNGRIEPSKMKKIYFGTRTHSQVDKVIHEMEKTLYRPIMSVLASRTHYCIHHEVSKKKGSNLIFECKSLCEKDMCEYKKNKDALVFNEEFYPSGKKEIWDIEDLINYGNDLEACPFFAARGIAKMADIVFCPYQYLINPQVRKRVGVSLKDSIVILDEAHNIESLCTESASFETTLSEMQDISEEYRHCVGTIEKVLKPSMKVIDGLIAWMDIALKSLQPIDYEESFGHWDCDNFISLIGDYGLTSKNFNTTKKKTLKALEELTNDSHELSPKTVIFLENFYQVLNFLFMKNKEYIKDYNIIVKQSWMKDEDENMYSIETFGLWCLNPGVVFNTIDKSCHSIILTSGTLSPLTSFEGELESVFNDQLEADHVIDHQSQLWIGSINKSFEGNTLKAIFSNHDSCEFQDSIGEMVYSISERVPNGVLCFFPSYTMMNKLTARWNNTGLSKRLRSIKDIVTETNGAAFDRSLAQFKVAARKKKGAIFLAVFRGKVSEGLDFDDECARAVIVIGLPYPSATDNKIKLKMEYNNNKHIITENVLTGKDWYNLQAFRAINQAIGRCIRHVNDYGAIILVDERYSYSVTKPKLSKWVRDHIQSFNEPIEALESLSNFFS